MILVEMTFHHRLQPTMRCHFARLMVDLRYPRTEGWTNGRWLGGCARIRGPAQKMVIVITGRVGPVAVRTARRGRSVGVTIDRYGDVRRGRTSVELSIGDDQGKVLLGMSNVPVRQFVVTFKTVTETRIKPVAEAGARKMFCRLSAPSAGTVAVPSMAIALSEADTPLRNRSWTPR